MLNSITIDRYLHAILALQSRYLVVRAVDVAAWLDCSKPSVSVAVKQMIQADLVYIGHHYALLLTESGVDEAVARKEAGALACSLSNPSLEAIRKRFSLQQNA